MNTFFRSLAPALRVGYMVLPEDLMAKFRENPGLLRLHRVSFEAIYPGPLFVGGYFEAYQPDAEKVTAPAGRRFGPFWKTARPVRHPGQEAGLHFSPAAGNAPER